MQIERDLNQDLEAALAENETHKKACTYARGHTHIAMPMITYKYGYGNTCGLLHGYVYGYLFGPQVDAWVAPVW